MCLPGKSSVAGFKGSAAPSVFPSCHSLTIFVALSAACFGSSELSAQNLEKTPTEELRKYSLEELMQIEVTSVSRREERASEAAAAVTVVTGDEIRRSGATSIPDALRYVEGLHVARANNQDWGISSRGFNASIANLNVANKLLVLMDGRSLYTPLFSGVLWDVQDTLLEDIDRIEVVRGPGATLWGANAVNGIINIVTKSARETQGVLLSGIAGTEERLAASGRYGGKINDQAHYRIYGTYFERDESNLPTGQPAHDAWNMGQGGFRIDWEPHTQTVINFQGDFYGGRQDERQVILYPGPPFRQLVEDRSTLQGGNFLGRLTHDFSEKSQLQFQAYYDRTHRSFPSFFNETRDSVGIDLQHHFGLGERHLISWGLGYDWTQDNVGNTYGLSFSPPQREADVYSAFLQDQISLIPERLILTLGSKFEHDDYTGFEVQPSARLALHPTDDQTVWAAVSRAVRRPTRAEHDVRLRSELNGPGLPPGSHNLFLGNPAFESETVLAYELGYRIQPHRRVTVDIATFYNVYDDLRSLEFGTPQLVGGVVQVPVRAGNFLEGETYGFETGVGVQLADPWRVRAGYALLKKDLRLEPGSRDQTGGAFEGNDPEHQFFLRSMVDLPRGWEFDAGMKYVDALPQPAIPSYWLLDLRLGWRPCPNWEFAVVGRNLLQRQHQEFGVGNAIEPSVYGKVTWRF
jgi:iron complex outermembrane receptor protein